MSFLGVIILLAVLIGIAIKFYGKANWQIAADNYQDEQAILVTEGSYIYKLAGYPEDEIQIKRKSAKNKILDVGKASFYLQGLQADGLVSYLRLWPALADERRKIQRYKFITPMRVSFQVRDKWYKGFLGDLSEKGIRVLTSREFADGQVKQILLDDFNRFQTSGKIVWQNKVKETDIIEEYKLNMGIQFDRELPPGSVEKYFRDVQ